MKVWVTIHRPRGWTPPAADEGMRRDIDALNDAMVAAGVRLFVAGLQPPERAAALRLQSDGTVSAQPGPYADSETFVNGFWVLETATLDEALEWGRRAAAACRGDVEVRPIH